MKEGRHTMKCGDRVSFYLSVRGEDVQVFGEVIAKQKYFDERFPAWMVRVDNIPEEYKYIQDAQGALRCAEDRLTLCQGGSNESN